MPRSPGREATSRVVTLETLLRRYWRSNPLACDTLEGISQWWLPAGHGATLHEVHAALTSLEERALVEKIVGADGTTHFRLRAEVATRPYLLDADPPAPPPGTH
jgi:hypothetical protein